MRYVAPLVAALVPLVITPSFVFHFDVTPKVAILVCGVALILFNFRANLHKFYKLFAEPAGHGFVTLLGAALAAMTLGTLFSSHPMFSLNGSTWRRLGLIPETALVLFGVVATAWLLAEPENTRTLLRFCTVSGGLCALYAIAQYFGWDPLMPAAAYHVGEGQFQIVRPPGTLGHADYFAAWLVGIMFLALGLARLETTQLLKRCSVTVAVLAAVAIVLSGTRSAILGTIAGLVVVTAMVRVRMMRAVAAVLAVGVAAAIFFVSPAGEKLRARVHWSLEDARGGARLLLWRDSLQMAAHRPLAGFGPESFATEFPRFQSAELARAYPDFYHESPHNIFLDKLTSEGLPGLAALLGLCAFGVRCCGRCAKLKHPLAAPLSAALAGILVTQQFIVFTLPTELYFVLVLSLLTASTAEPAPRTDALPRVPVLAAVPAVALALLFLGYSARLIAGDAALLIAQRQIDEGNITRAAEAYRTVLRFQLPGVGDDLQYSRSLQRLAAQSRVLITSINARQQALVSGLRATTTAEDRQNAWYNLAMLRAVNNDAAGVESALRAAIDCAPTWFKPRWTLAQVLALTGQREEALREAQAAVELNGGRDAEVTETWNKLRSPDVQPR